LIRHHYRIRIGWRKKRSKTRFGSEDRKGYFAAIWAEAIWQINKQTATFGTPTPFVCSEIVSKRLWHCCKRKEGEAGKGIIFLSLQTI